MLQGQSERGVIGPCWESQVTCSLSCLFYILMRRPFSWRFGQNVPLTIGCVRGGKSLRTTAFGRLLDLRHVLKEDSRKLEIVFKSSMGKK